ncbi:MAG: M48 family metalloprotease [Pseudomonadota bacterium]
MRVLVSALLITCAIQAHGFEQLPSLVKPGFAPSTHELEGGLWMVMANAEEDLQRSPLLIDRPDLNRYLMDIVCRLVESYCGDIRVYVIRTPHFNATMAPNGMMQIWTGLLIRVRNEAQLAAIIGHEIGHYLRRHSLQRYEDLKMKATFSTVIALGLGGAVAAGGVSPDIANLASSVGNFALLASIFSYSRSHESEADKFGIQLLDTAGYDVDQASLVWGQILKEEDSATQKKSSGSLFFSSHPSPSKRLETLASYANDLTEHEQLHEQGATDFAQAINPLLFTVLEDQLNTGDFGRSRFVLEQLQSGEHDQSIVSFFLGELYRSRNEEGDRDRAAAYFRQAISSDSPTPQAYRALGMIELKNKNLDAAKARFREYLSLQPEAKDRKMIEFYLEY